MSKNLEKQEVKYKILAILCTFCYTCYRTIKILQQFRSQTAQTGGSLKMCGAGWKVSDREKANSPSLWPAVIQAGTYKEERR